MEKELTFGEKLTRMRNMRNLKMSELAKLSNVPLSTINDLEKGRAKSPTIDTVEKLSEALRISPIYFFRKQAVTPFDIEELDELLPEELRKAVLTADFMPYIVLSEKAYREQIPTKVIESFLDAIIESLNFKKN